MSDEIRELLNKRKQIVIQRDDIYNSYEKERNKYTEQINKISDTIDELLKKEIQSKIPLKSDFIIPSDYNKDDCIYNISLIENITIWDEKISFTAKNCNIINIETLREEYYEEFSLTFLIDSIPLIKKLTLKQKEKIREILDKKEGLIKDLKSIFIKNKKTYEIL